MTTLWQVPAAVVALLAWLALPPSSLADAARREAVRRAAVAPAAAVLSNQNLPPDWVVSPSSRPASTEAAAAPAEAEPAAVDASAPASPSDASGTQQAAPAPTSAPAAAVTGGAAASPKGIPAADDEQAWRDQMSTLRTALASDQAKAASLQTQINGLQTDFVNRDDPGQKSVLEQQLRQALADLDKARAQIQTDTAAIQALREQARRADVPAGWTR